MCLETLYRIFCITVIVSLSDTCPDICSCKNGLVNCSRRNLVALPKGILPDTMEINLSHNNLKRVPSGLVAIKNLTRLNLSYNKISMIYKGDLNAIMKVTHLDLSFNLLHDSKDVRFTEFASMLFLEELNLSGNVMKKINPINSYSMKKLLINNCSLLTLDLRQLLFTMPNLQYLNCSNNLISNVTAAQSKTLEVLDLSACNLKVIGKQDFVNLNNLQYLYIRANEHLRTFSSDSSSILELDLSNCNLDAVPSGNLRKVIRANLHGNHIQATNRHTFANLIALEHLDLSYNAISSIELHSFDTLSQIKELDFSYNTLRTLHVRTFKMNKNLKIAKLSHNYFTNVIGLESDSLIYIDFSVCEIKEISSFSLIGMTQLKFLNLSRNLISSLPDFLEAPYLHTLDVSLCHIKSVNNKTFSQLMSLKVLNLSGNRISFISPSYFPPILYLDLNDNPWRCDCDRLKPMYEWLSNTGQKTSRLICQSPEEVEGFSWSEACDGHWNNNPSKDTIWWYSIILIIIMSFVLIAVVVMQKIHKVKKQRREESEATRRAHEREALNRMQRMQQEAREESSRNAPDPRELQRPPSYHEALLLPRLDTSNWSLNSQHSRNSDISKKARVRRKGKRKSASSEGRPASHISVESDSSTGAPPPLQLLQSDF